MTSTGEANWSTLRAWADDAYDLRPDTPPVEVRTRLLRELAQADFQPPAEFHAVCLLFAQPGSGAPSPAPNVRAARQWRHDQLRGEVEEFAATFFSNGAAARRALWQCLQTEAAEWPCLAARLAALSPGLDLNLDEYRSLPQACQTLAEEIWRLFPLRPPARALERQKLLARVEPRRMVWESAAQRLAQKHPQIAALEPELMKTLSTWSGRAETAALMERLKLQAQYAAEAKASTPNGGAKWDPKSLIWIAVMVIFWIGKAVLDGPTHSTPHYREFKPKPSELNLTPEEQRDLQEFLLRPRPRPIEPAADGEAEASRTAEDAVEGSFTPAPRPPFGEPAAP